MASFLLICFLSLFMPATKLLAEAEDTSLTSSAYKHESAYDDSAYEDSEHDDSEHEDSEQESSQLL